MYLDIYINGTNVGYVLQTIQTPIMPKSSAKIPLTASVNITDAFNNLTTQLGGLLGIKGTNKEMGIKTIGHVSVVSGFVSTTVPISFTKNMVL